MLVSIKKYLVKSYSRQLSALALGHSPFASLPSATSLTRIALFPRIGVAFTRVQKNANSFIVQLLAEAEIQRSSIGAPRDIGSVRLGKGNDVKDEFTIVAGDIRALSRIKGLPLFAVRRNPYARTLSAFLDKSRLPEFQQRHGSFERSPEGFQHFVRWLALDGGLPKDTHWAPQVDSLLPLHYYTQVLPQEDLGCSLRALLAYLSIEVPDERLRRLSVDETSHHQFAESRIRRFYSVDSARTIAEIYRQDFDTLGYSTDINDAQ